MTFRIAVSYLRLSAYICGLHLMFVASGLAKTTNFLAGADFSDLALFEARGIVYKDHGQVQDALQILKNHGINCVRLRLWTSSAAQAAAIPFNYLNNLTYTVPLAVRVKKAGLLFALDFHYSDTWADPGKQATPSEWTNLNFSQLVQQMRTYNSNTIATFAAAGAMPDYVQIGNEITHGMMWPYGRLSGSTNASWSQLGQLMKAAVDGIQDATNTFGAAMPKIIVHIDRGGDWLRTKWFFDNLNYQHVPYDIIGESYYPFWHGSPASLNICLSNAALRYGKPVIIAEDAFPFSDRCPTNWLSHLYGYPPTSAGQARFVAALGKMLKRVPNQLGAGFFYWGAEFRARRGSAGGEFSRASFFGFDGNVLPVVDVIGAMGAQSAKKASSNSAALPPKLRH